MNWTKHILKAIFPAPFLKATFLVYNRIKIKTIDRILFSELKITPGQFIHYRIAKPFLENKIDIDDMPVGRVRDYMRQWFSWSQNEYILRLEVPCWIEPDHGWAIASPNKLVYFSLGVSRTPFQKKPAWIRFLFRRNILMFDGAISLRDTGEENYFHFYNDVLTKLYFLQVHFVHIQDLPIIVSKKLWNKPYFQFYKSRSPMLQQLKWVVQDSQYIYVKHAWFAKPLTLRKDLWDAVLAPLALKKSQGNRKILLTRQRTRLRFIENISEIEGISRGLGFEIVDTDQLTPADQIRIFSETSHLVGIHGAGLTNMVFRKGNCRVLEIFPPSDEYLPFHYIMLARMSGFHYQAMIGDTGRERWSGGFCVDKGEFLNAVMELTTKSY